MSMIRRQSIISSIVIYIGFAVGMLNVYFFTREGLFTPAQYGLTKLFIDIAVMMAALAGLAMPSYIFKFHPYYQHHLPANKNDMATWALLIGSVGFLLVMLAGWFFKDLVIRKFGRNSPDLVTYFYWIFPLGFGINLYTILEAYTWSIHRPVLTNFLKEILWRLLTTVIIVLFLFQMISSFGVFIKLYALTYPAIVAVLVVYLISTKQIQFTFRRSKVTRRYISRMISLCLYAYSGTLVFTLSGIFDSLVIAAVLDDGLSKAGIFGLAQIMTSVIQAPQRGVVAAAIAHLSKAWKEKNMPMLQKIYQRSSINLLLFAAGIFVLIALNYTEAIYTFGLKDAYLAGFSAFVLLGLTRVVDLGTGLNAQIIGTSNYWRFDLVSGVILLALMMPLTYLLAKKFDILGPAAANLISVSIYNVIRIAFLWKKFKLQPFTSSSFYILVIAVCSYAISYFAFRQVHGFSGIVLRSMLFIVLYGGSVFYFKLSPDVQPVWESLRKRIRL